MFKDSEAFSEFSIQDVAATRQFYIETLGLTVTDVEGMVGFGMLELHIKGSRKILMYHKDDHQPATFTVLSFIVPNIDNAVDELIDKGVDIIRYDFPDDRQDEKGIVRGLAAQQGPDIAWFADPSGNILAVLQSD